MDALVAPPLDGPPPAPPPPEGPPPGAGPGVGDPPGRGAGYAGPAPAPAPRPAIGGASGLAAPHSVEGEREVLAAVLVEPTSMDQLLEGLTTDDFYLEAHGLLFDAMQRVYERTQTVDLVTLRQDLRDHGHFERAGGDMALARLLDRAGTTANLAHYVHIVRDKALVRRMIAAAQTIESEGFQDVSDLTSYLDRAEQSVFAVLENRQNTNLRPMSEVVRASLDQIQAAYDNEGGVTGVGTGFVDLDHLTHGLQAGDLVIIAARPAMGKTSFALNVATNAALKHQRTAAIFSLEMPAEQLASRMLASQAQVDVSSLRGGMLREEDWPRLMTAAEALTQADIYMDDTPGATASAIRAMCRRLKRRGGLDLVVIDYLQLMAGERGRSREEDISHISRSLKHLAKELSIPVVALSQLNRGPEGRTDKRPLMSDLRESGAIEQDADIIMFLYRDEVYNKSIEEDQRGVAELIIAKHRNGPTATVRLKFWHAYTRFDSLARDPM